MAHEERGGQRAREREVTVSRVAAVPGPGCVDDGK